MRILFAASPAIAIPALEAVSGLGGSAGKDGGADGIVLAGLLTNPDSSRGRSSLPKPTDCAAAAVHLSSGSPLGGTFPILKPEKLDAAARAAIVPLKPDLLVSFAYGRIFGPKFLALFPLGGINIHPSLLPKYRGPTPIPAAIIGRETETGLTIQKIALEMDSGDIIAQEKVPLDGTETTAALTLTMAALAARMLPSALAGIAKGTCIPQPQDNKAASFCSLLVKEDGLIDWNLGAADIEARIRAYDPWPLSWTNHGAAQLCILKAKVYEKPPPETAAVQPGIEQSAKPPCPGQVLGKDPANGILIQTGAGILSVTELQYHTKKALRWKDFLNGTRNFIGTRLG